TALYTRSLHDALPIWFSRVVLYWRLAERRDGPPDAEFQPVTIPLASPRALDQEVLARWLPEPGRPLQPGDVVEFFGEVRDNDARSEEHTSELQSRENL